MTHFQFQLILSRENARRGAFSTPHGTFQTPNFMPVGTRGTVKGLNVSQLQDVGAQIILCNTYHLWLRPGETVVRKLGDIHGFSGWRGPILSDSGGFQVFSLKDTRKVTEDGVQFRSHIDGELRFLSPEKAIQIQETLGVDIAMMLDECPESTLSLEDTRKSLELTIRWAKRGIAARRLPNKTAMFGITQGGCFQELRTQSAAEMSELPFNGFAIGGLSVGEKKEKMYEVLSYHPVQLPSNKIRYLMGVGTPEDIVEAVKSGVDLFDCVMPTRAGRFGRAFISDLPYVNIKNSSFQLDDQPLDHRCDCYCCKTYSRGYLNHLFKNDEMLGPQLLTLHNLRHYLSLMERIRQSLETNTFGELYKEVKDRWKLRPERAAPALAAEVAGDDTHTTGDSSEELRS